MGLLSGGLVFGDPSQRAGQAQAVYTLKYTREA
jgi:hypothetical protein